MYHLDTIRMTLANGIGPNMFRMACTPKAVRAHCQGGRVLAASMLAWICGGGDVGLTRCPGGGGVLKELGGAGGGIGTGSSSYS